MAKNVKSFRKGIKLYDINSGPNVLSEDATFQEEGILWVNNGSFKCYLDSGTRTVATLDQSQNLSNKNLLDNSTYIIDNGDATKRLLFSVGGNTTDKDLTLVSAVTDDRNLTFPDATDTLIGRDTTDTLTNKSIDSDNNTITNIVNDDIKASAGIVTTKLADATWIAESVTFFQNTDITGAEAETLTDGSDASTLHIHDARYYTESELGSTVDSSSGADLIGSTSITNVTGNTIQSQLESIAGRQSEALATATLNDNATTTVFSVTKTGNNHMTIEYRIQRSTAYETGILMLVHDETNAYVSTHCTNTVNPGVDFTATISGGNVILRATLTSTGNNATMKYYKRVIS